MELNETSPKEKGLQVSLKRISSPRRGLSREEAATYIGISPSLFDELVKSGTMPKPIRIKSRTVWGVHQLDKYFEDLSTPNDNPWDQLR
jgi:predicted DNA-binding transcriptional regulator AlpA